MPLSRKSGSFSRDDQSQRQGNARPEPWSPAAGEDEPRRRRHPARQRHQQHAGATTPLQRPRQVPGARRGAQRAGEDRVKQPAEPPVVVWYETEPAQVLGHLDQVETDDPGQERRDQPRRAVEDRPEKQRRHEHAEGADLVKARARIGDETLAHTNSPWPHE